MSSEQCTRCAKCCKAMPCGIALCFFGDIRPCPAIETGVNGKRSCGLILHVSEYINVGEAAEWKNEFLSKLFSHMLGVGYGCCSSPEKEMLSAEMRKSIKKHKVNLTP